MSDNKIDIRSYNFSEVKALVVKMGEKPFRAKQLYEWMHQKQAETFSQMTNLPKSFLTALEESCVLVTLKKETVQVSAEDGTRKYLFALSGGSLIESVLMRYRYGNSVCISSQVGCRMGCKFCASTIDGLVRGLTASEMLEQVYRIGRDIGERISHVVVMGSGEPLDNYENTVKFLKNVSAEGGINISPRNISLSTCGIVPKIYSLADEGLPVNLTISLHQVTDEGRARTMPVAKKYSIAEILKACEYYFDRTGRRYIFEYSLIAGENSDAEHAEGLINLLKGRPCHVNLIRLNEVKERDLKSITDKRAYAFAAMLEKGGLSATVRRSMGAEIGGACGQLRAGFINKS